MICEREICSGCGAILSTLKCPRCGTEHEPRPEPKDDKPPREVGP